MWLTNPNRPSVTQTTRYRFIFPYLRYLGPAWFRRMLLDMVPNRGVQRIKNVTNIVHEKSKEIFLAKKSAIERGDQELLHTVGEGKDIMSILCEYPVRSVIPRRTHRVHDSAVKANVLASEEDKLPDDELLAQTSCVLSVHTIFLQSSQHTVIQLFHDCWSGHHVERSFSCLASAFGAPRCSSQAAQ